MISEIRAVGSRIRGYARNLILCAWVFGQKQRPHFHAASRRPSLQAVSFWPERAATSSMKNGLYSIHIHMLDGVRGPRQWGAGAPGRRADRWGPLFLVRRLLHRWQRYLERSTDHQSTHALRRPLCSPAIRRAGGHQRFFGDFCRRPGRGFRDDARGQPKPEFSRDVEEARGWLKRRGVPASVSVVLPSQVGVCFAESGKEAYMPVLDRTFYQTWRPPWPPYQASRWMQFMSQAQPSLV